MVMKITSPQPLSRSIFTAPFQSTTVNRCDSLPTCHLFLLPCQDGLSTRSNVYSASVKTTRCIRTNGEGCSCVVHKNAHNNNTGQKKNFVYSPVIGF